MVSTPHLTVGIGTTTVRRFNPGWPAASAYARGSRECAIPMPTHVKAYPRRRDRDNGAYEGTQLVGIRRSKGRTTVVLLESPKLGEMWSWSPVQGRISGLSECQLHNF